MPDSLASQLMMLDLQVALDRVGGDADLLQEVAQLFLGDCPRSMNEIRGAIADGDAKRLEREAHSLKGSVANFGAEAVVKAALDLEVSGRAGNLSDARDQLERLERHLEALQPELVKLSRT